MLLVKVDELDFAIPLRSNIKHNNVLWTDKANYCGADYSKAIIITNPIYIDNVRIPTIRPNELKALLGEEYNIKIGLEKYIKKYRKAYRDRDISRNKVFCQYSTLQYFHSRIKYYLIKLIWLDLKPYQTYYSCDCYTTNVVIDPTL